MKPNIYKDRYIEITNSIYIDKGKPILNALQMIKDFFTSSGSQYKMFSNSPLKIEDLFLVLDYKIAKIQGVKSNFNFQSTIFKYVNQPIAEVLINDIKQEELREIIEDKKGEYKLLETSQIYISRDVKKIYGSVDFSNIKINLTLWKTNILTSLLSLNITQLFRDIEELNDIEGIKTIRKYQNQMENEIDEYKEIIEDFKIENRSLKREIELLRKQYPQKIVSLENEIKSIKNKYNITDYSYLSDDFELSTFDFDTISETNDRIKVNHNQDSELNSTITENEHFELESKNFKLQKQFTETDPNKTIESNEGTIFNDNYYNMYNQLLENYQKLQDQYEKLIESSKEKLTINFQSFSQSSITTASENTEIDTNKINMKDETNKKIFQLEEAILLQYIQNHEHILLNREMITQYNFSLNEELMPLANTGRTFPNKVLKTENLNIFNYYNSSNSNKNFEVEEVERTRMISNEKIDEINEIKKKIEKLDLELLRLEKISEVKEEEVKFSEERYNEILKLEEVNIIANDKKSCFKKEISKHFDVINEENRELLEKKLTASEIKNEKILKGILKERNTEIINLRLKSEEKMSLLKDEMDKIKVESDVEVEKLKVEHSIIEEDLKRKLLKMEISIEERNEEIKARKIEEGESIKGLKLLEGIIKEKNEIIKRSESNERNMKLQILQLECIINEKSKEVEVVKELYDRIKEEDLTSKRLNQEIEAIKKESLERVKYEEELKSKEERLKEMLEELKEKEEEKSQEMLKLEDELKSKEEIIKKESLERVKYEEELKSKEERLKEMLEEIIRLKESLEIAEKEKELSWKNEGIRVKELIEAINKKDTEVSELKSIVERIDLFNEENKTQLSEIEELKKTIEELKKENYNIELKAATINEDLNKIINVEKKRIEELEDIIIVKEKEKGELKKFENKVTEEKIIIEEKQREEILNLQKKLKELETYHKEMEIHRNEASEIINLQQSEISENSHIKAEFQILNRVYLILYNEYNLLVEKVREINDEQEDNQILVIEKLNELLKCRESEIEVLRIKQHNLELLPSRIKDIISIVPEEDINTVEPTDEFELIKILLENYRKNIDLLSLTISKQSEDIEVLNNLKALSEVMMSNNLNQNDVISIINSFNEIRKERNSTENDEFLLNNELIMKISEILSMSEGIISNDNLLDYIEMIGEKIQMEKDTNENLYVQIDEMELLFSSAIKIIENIFIILDLDVPNYEIKNIPDLINCIYEYLQSNFVKAYSPKNELNTIQPGSTFLETYNMFQEEVLSFNINKNSYIFMTNYINKLSFEKSILARHIAFLNKKIYSQDTI